MEHSSNITITGVQLICTIVALRAPHNWLILLSCPFLANLWKFTLFPLGPNLYSSTLGKTIILHSFSRFLLGTHHVLSTRTEPGHTVVHKKDTLLPSQSS